VIYTVSQMSLLDPTTLDAKLGVGNMEPQEILKALRREPKMA